VRAFLGIPVEPPALEAFHALRERLLADVPAVRWAPAASPHITIHFFGSISAADATRAGDVLRVVIGALPAMQLCLRGLGGFPSTVSPRVLWCGVDGETGALHHCATACHQALRRSGFPVEERPYRAHCTVGRPRQPWPALARERWRAHVDAAPTMPSFVAGRAVVYESLTSAAGVAQVPRETLAFHAQREIP
jgi:2'-5' RNA ligase